MNASNRWTSLSRGLLMIAGVCLLVSIGSCTKSDVVVKFHVTVRTNQDEPVAGASVKIDDREIGVTDGSGRLEAEVSMPPESRRRIEIVKTSDTYYFAPFSQSFVAAESGTQEVPISAVLYFIPKPGTEPAVVESTPTPEATATVEAKEPQKKEVAAVAPAAVTPEAVPTAKVRLSPVEEAPATPGQDATAPEIVATGIMTVYVDSGKTPVRDVEVLYGERENGELTSGCKTNERGRCVIRFKPLPSGSMTFVARKSGYKVDPIVAAVVADGKIRFDMDKGEVLEVQAVLQQYNQQRGLAGVDVMVKGVKAGETDGFGHLSWAYVGKKADLMDVTLSVTHYLPESFSTDFVVGGPMALTRYFVPKTPPAPRVALLGAAPAGAMEAVHASLIEGSLDEAIRDAAKRSLFSSGFQEVSSDPLLKNLGTKGLTSSLRRGWKPSPRVNVDAVLIPTVVFSRAASGAKATPSQLELALVDARGKVLVAAKEKLSGYGDDAVGRSVSSLSRRLLRGFPFEGAVLERGPKFVTINMGSSSAGGIQSGDELDVYGVQSNRAGSQQKQQKIALLKVSRVSDRSSECEVRQLEPRASISKGDLVVLRPRALPTVVAEEGAKIRVVTAARGGDTEAVAQANVYFNEKWVGSTDDEGLLVASTSGIKGEGTLRVVKQGFAESVITTALAKSRPVDVRMSRAQSFLRINSNPSGAKVRVEGKPLGKTPLMSPVPVPGGFVRIEVEGPQGFKIYSQVMEMDQGTLDLTGPNAIILERDLRAIAKELLASGKVKQALAQLESVPAGHTDYLLANHEAGEIYLTMLADPARAAGAFAKVTANPAVKEFLDKRFIGSHVDEGIALFLAAEKLRGSDPAAARAHYDKVVSVLSGVHSQLRFVPRDQFGQSLHQTEYHLALAKHRLWQVSKDAGLLSQVVASWRTYLDGTVKTVPAEGDGKSLGEAAQVYYKQASAALASASAAENRK
jgi:hypothetical protein